MSYYKIAAVAPATINKIRFYYPTETLLTRVKKITSFRAKYAEGGFDKIQVSDDEKELMVEHLKKCFLQLFDLLFFLNQSDSVSHNQGLVLTGATTVTAGSFVAGSAYTIKTIGTTNYTLIGASANTVGVTFTATGAGSGTGTAETSIYATYADIKDNEKYRTINLDFIDTSMEQAAVDFLVSKWYIMNGLADEAKIHFTEYQNALEDISKRTIALRQY